MYRLSHGELLPLLRNMRPDTEVVFLLDGRPWYLVRMAKISFDSDMKRWTDRAEFRRLDDELPDPFVPINNRLGAEPGDRYTQYPIVMIPSLIRRARSEGKNLRWTARTRETRTASV
jgi:hypothetical protein